MNVHRSQPVTIRPEVPAVRAAAGHASSVAVHPNRSTTWDNSLVSKRSKQSKRSTKLQTLQPGPHLPLVFISWILVSQWVKAMWQHLFVPAVLKAKRCWDNKAQKAPPGLSLEAVTNSSLCTAPWRSKFYNSCLYSNSGKTWKDHLEPSNCLCL